MASLASQRDFVSSLKKETLLNVGILRKFHHMPSDLSQLLKDNNLEKPTQNLFNHLAYYFVSIIDPKVILPWPLYDTKAERTYRNQLSAFITDYSSKGLLAPVMTSYLVNPGCYKVTFLILQLSQLAVQRTLVTKMKQDYQTELYKAITLKYKSQKAENVIQDIEKETYKVNEIKSAKISNYLRKKEALVNIAAKLRQQITQNEETLKTLKMQEFLDNLIDGYIKKHSSLDLQTKKEILEIKNVRTPAKYFDKCLDDIDSQISIMESVWEAKTGSLLKLCQTTRRNTETLIARQTGEADKRMYTIEYNPKTDDISTEELERQVNASQKYVLKNIISEGKLNFPNLIRGFLISISYILNNTEIGDEIFNFNEYLGEGRRSYSETVNSMRMIMERVMNADGRLQQRQITTKEINSMRNFAEIPPLPDLSDLKMNREYYPQVLLDAFTPLNFRKHQFNLRKQKTGSFTKPPANVFATPFRTVPKEDFFKSSISCRVSAYDMNATQNNLNHNISAISQATNSANETIGACSSGFTKEQIFRLLSTKKTSSSKKFKHKTVRPTVKVIKCALFNESTVSNESRALFRSHSSPNLYENQEKRPRNNLRMGALATMKESPSFLEVSEISGFAALDRDSNHSTPQGLTPLESSSKLIDTSSLPSISNIVRRSVSSNTSQTDLNKEIEFKEPQIIQPKPKCKEPSERSRIPQRKGKELVPQQKRKVLITTNILPQRKSKESFEQDVLPQSKSNESIENNILPQRKGAESLAQNILPQRKSTESFAQNIVPQRNSTEIFESPVTLAPQQNSTELIKEYSNTHTPQNNAPTVKRTSSLEKIINRFKIVRASVLPTESREDNDFKTIFEEKENVNTDNADVVNRNLLPDLLSPSFSSITTRSSCYLEEIYFDVSDEDIPRRPRESLGTALGVDHTFLDQFELVD